MVEGHFAVKPTHSLLVKLQTSQLVETFDLKFALYSRYKC